MRRPRPPRHPRPALSADRAGLSTVEYIIALVLVAVAALALWKQLGDDMDYVMRSTTADIQRR